MHTFTIPSAVFRAVASFRPKGHVRYYLNGVLLEVTPSGNMYLVATNGHAICVADLGKLRTTSVEPGQYIEPFRFIIDAQLSNAVEILESAKNAELEFEIPGPQSTTINATIKSLKKGSQTIICKGIEGKYPDWQRVVNSYKKPLPSWQIPANTEQKTKSPQVYIHPDYVKLIDSAAKYLRGIGKDKDASVFIQPGETETSLTCAKLDNGGYVWAYVMPVRVDTDKFIDPPSYS
jgi:hypothetical protein